MANSYDRILEKINSVFAQYSSLTEAEAYKIFSRMGWGTANMPIIQNQRIKSISTLPVEYNRQQIADFLRRPYFNEIALRNTSEILKWTTYPYYKIIKTYADIPSYKYYVKPLYITNEQAKSAEFKREMCLIDKINKALSPETYAHKIAGQALSQGKVFYTYRASVDKSHNRVNHIFLQQLPEDWCYIIGYNNISKYTISFNMMYFLQPGTDYTQYGDLFRPYVEDFNEMFLPPKDTSKKYVYASGIEMDCKGKKVTFYPQNRKQNAEGSPRVFMQNDRWFYYVSLPIDKVFTFEIDDTTPTVASPLSGLMLAYSQLSDYEALQKELVSNPLLKIFTGEIPYFSDNGTTTEDGYRLSSAGRILFEAYFMQLMAQAGIGGTIFYSAPTQNIKSHDYPETSTANQTSEAYNRYVNEKSGLSTLIPSSSDIKASQVDVAKKLEGRYVTATIYPQFSNMMNWIYNSLNLNFEWEFSFIGTIFNEQDIRDNALKDIANGDLTAHFILAALDGQSICDKLSMMNVISESGILEKLTPPVTSYTMSKDGGRPSKSIEDIDDNDATEKAKDAYGEE